MASGDEQGRDEGGSGFGPPVSGFGPPLNDFGPPTGESDPIGWSPVGEPERPTLGWQPADGPAAPPVPAPPAQYRAPDSASAPEAARRPESPETVRRPAPETRRMPAPETTRAEAAAETVRYSGVPQTPADTGEDRGKCWHTDDSKYPPTPPRSGSGSLWDDDELAKKLTVPREGRESSEAKGGSGSLWDDDELAKKLAPAPRPVVPPSAPGSERNMGLILGGVGAAVVIVVALVLVIMFATRGGGGDNPGGGGGASSASAAALSCPARTEGNVTIGNGPGDTSSGASAILAFQHAFYADRSGAKAREFVAPDAENVSTAATMQQAIDGQIPVGTSYCLRVETITPDQFNVDLTEHRPDGITTLYKQLVKTVNRDGKNLIFSIAQR